MYCLVTLIYTKFDRTGINERGIKTIQLPGIAVRNLCLCYHTMNKKSWKKNLNKKYCHVLKPKYKMEGEHSTSKCTQVLSSWRFGFAKAMAIEKLKLESFTINAKNDWTNVLQELATWEHSRTCIRKKIVQPTSIYYDKILLPKFWLCYDIKQT